jgi:hypothetical protein
MSADAGGPPEPQWGYRLHDGRMRLGCSWSVPAGHPPSWGESAARTAGEWPLGEVDRTGRVVRFARLIYRPVRVLGVPTARAAYGANSGF